MNCVECGSKTAVKDSRPDFVDKKSIYPRRECRKCGHRFSTTETPDTLHYADEEPERLKMLKRVRLMTSERIKALLVITETVRDNKCAP